MRIKTLGKLISGLILAYFIVSSPFAYGETDLVAMRLQVNNTLVITTAGKCNLVIPPKLVNGQVMIPLDFISKKLGLEVTLDNATQMITLTNSEKSRQIVLFIGKNEIVIDGKERIPCVPPNYESWKIFVPAKALAEAFSATVEWNAQTQEITITPQGVEKLPLSTTKPVVTKKTNGSMGILPDGKELMNEIYGEKKANYILASALKALKDYPIVNEDENGKKVDTSSIDKYNGYMDKCIAKNPKSKSTYEYYKYKKTPIKSISFLKKPLKVEANDFAYLSQAGTYGFIPVSYMQKCIDSNSLNNPNRVYERVYSISKPFRGIVSIELGEDNEPYPNAGISVWIEGYQGYFSHSGGTSSRYVWSGGEGPMYDKDGNAFVSRRTICSDQGIIFGIILNKIPLE